MKADFNRVLFHKTERGTYVTVSMYDEIREERLHLAYLAEGALPIGEETYPLDILAVGDFRAETLELLYCMVRQRSIRTVVLPAGEGCEEVQQFCREAGVPEVQIVREAYAVKKTRWELLFWSFPGVRDGALVAFVRFIGCDPREEDCVLTGKIVYQEPCVSCIYGEDDYCGFGCLRGRDFDVLKGHKRSGSAGYRMGVLLLGSVSPGGQREELARALKGYEDELRCICLPCEIEEGAFDAGPSVSVPRQDYLYLVAPAGENGNRHIRRWPEPDPWLQYRAVGREYGFCLSGYRIPYLKRGSE